MAQYKVYWEMDIEADSPREAAESALRVHRKEDSEAVFFTVEQLSTGESVDIDLLEEEEEDEEEEDEADEDEDDIYENWARHPWREQRDRSD